MKRRWVWHEDHSSAVDMMGNVFRLLACKRSGLSKTTQSTLKVVVYFRTSNELVIGYLGNEVMS